MGWVIPFAANIFMSTESIPLFMETCQKSACASSYLQNHQVHWVWQWRSSPYGEGRVRSEPSLIHTWWFTCCESVLWRLYIIKATLETIKLCWSWNSLTCSGVIKMTNSFLFKGAALRLNSHDLLHHLVLLRVAQAHNLDLSLRPNSASIKHWILN